MSDLRSLLRISRPRFWIYILGPYLIGLAAAIRSPADLLDLRVLVWALYFTLPANLLIYGINDIFDYETDRHNSKKKSFESLLDPALHKRILLYIIFLNLPFLILMIFTVPPIGIISMLGFLFFSIFYSTPPIRAKTKPLLDSVFNILYVFPGIFSYSMLIGGFPSVAVIIAAGLWTMAMHAYSAIPDISADKQANIPTIATLLGSTGTHVFCIICYVGAAAFSLRSIGYPAIVFGAAYVLMMILSMIASRSARIFDVYRKFPILNTIVGFALFWIVAYAKFIK